MTETFHCLSATLPNGEFKRMLVSEDEYADCDRNPADFFVPNATGAEHDGEVQISGDTHCLAGTYMED